jgi:hypothetical protein
MAVNNLNTPGVGIQPSIVDAKGDLLVGTAADAISRLGVTGTTGSVLTADAGETTGLKWAAAGSVGGLVHIKTVTDTGVASISLGSDADPLFSSEYDSYKIIVNGSNSSSSNYAFRLRANTTDETGTNYANQQTNSVGSTVSAALASAGAAADFALTVGAGTLLKRSVIELANPFLAAKTLITVHSMNETGPNNTLRSGFHNLTNSYNGFTLLVSVGNLTNATVSVYGYRK